MENTWKKLFFPAAEAFVVKIHLFSSGSFY